MSCSCLPICCYTRVSTRHEYTNCHPYSQLTLYNLISFSLLTLHAFRHFFLISFSLPTLLVSHYFFPSFTLSMAHSLTVTARLLPRLLLVSSLCSSPTRNDERQKEWVMRIKLVRNENMENQ